MTRQDLKTLETIMWSEIGTQADYEKEFGEMPVNKLVRKIVGLDRTVGNLSTLFKENLNDAKRIMNIVAEIKKNAEVVV